MTSDSNQNAALEGRMPVLPDERIFVSFWPFLWSCTTFGSGIGVFLVGVGLASVGDIRVTIPGFLIGLILGFVPPLLSGLPSFRYGIDMMDATKAAFGSRGTVIPLLGLLYVVFAWESVTTAFIAKGGATIAAHLSGSGISRAIEIALALLVVSVIWAVVRQGPRLLETLNNFVGPGLLLVAVGLLVLVAIRVGPSALWTGAAPASGRMTTDPHLALISAIELGVGATFGNWPTMGGLMRLVRFRKHVVTAPMLGLSIIGLGFGGAASAMIAVAVTSDDPVQWCLDLGGPWLGPVIATAILVGSMGIIGLLSYFGAVSIQQVKLLGRLPWGVVVAVTLIPAIIAAMNIEATLSSVVAVANYEGMVIVGLAGVYFADYFLMRRQNLEIAELFVDGYTSRYWFWGGINWIAVICVVAAAIIYRVLYDPATLASAPAFRYFGASLPAFAASVLLFAGLTTLLRTKTCIGGYNPSTTCSDINVSL